MFKINCYFALLILYLSCVHSWDIAITLGDQLEIYSNGTKEEVKDVRLTELTALAYDAVHNILLFVDKKSDNASIFLYDLLTKQVHPLVGRKGFEDIQGVAFDPVEQLLFWTDTSEKSIMVKPLFSKSKNDTYGKVLLKTDEETPRAIAVDSCRGYIYWTNISPQSATIERMRFDGSDRKVIVDTDIFIPTSIAIDQRNKKLYWADDRRGIHYSIESYDLERNVRTQVFKGTDHYPNALTISNDYIYWTDFGFKSIWKFPKKPEQGKTEPTNVITFTQFPYAIVANYSIEDQIQGVSECQQLMDISRNKSVLSDIFNTATKIEGWMCLHGVKTEEKCVCSAGYTGERCEVPICQNYCNNGECYLSTDNNPACKCKKGFKGVRCEISVCQNYCLNNGVCVLENDLPTCKCNSEYAGGRCEDKRVREVILPTNACNCTKEEDVPKTNMPLESEVSLLSDENIYVSQGWDPLRDPIIMLLGIVSGLLCVICALLVKKIMHLKRRPRIKKRIIVNKNVTPLTARPEQCEITIEDCCNMNICETPCFEPRTIKPIVDIKPGKEEKCNLIANMEHDDDLF